jgi:hypothetical protein
MKSANPEKQCVQRIEAGIAPKDLWKERYHGYKTKRKTSLPIIEFHGLASIILIIIEKCLLALCEEQNCSYSGTCLPSLCSFHLNWEFWFFWESSVPRSRTGHKAAAVIDANKRKKILNSWVSTEK